MDGFLDDGYEDVGANLEPTHEPPIPPPDPGDALDPVVEDTADETDDFLFQDNLRKDPSFRPHKAKSTRHEPVHTRSRSRSKSNSAEPPPLPAKSRDKSALDNPASVPVHATPDGFKSRPKIQRT